MVIDIAVIGAIGTGIVRTTIHTGRIITDRIIIGGITPTILITDIAGGIGVVRTSVST